MSDKPKEEKPVPIHLGELLKTSETAAAEGGAGAKKLTVNFPDHKEILYTKALLSELSGPEQQKRILEEQQNKDAEQEKRTRLKKIYEEEMQHSRINRMKLLNDWRVIMRIAKIDEIRKYLTLYMQIFERDLDDKDAILQMLDRDISEAEDHYNIALTNHFIHIRQLVALQDSRVKGLFKEFEGDVRDLENEFNDEFSELKKQFESEQNDILRMLNNITQSYDRKLAKLNQDFQELKNSQIQKINEVYSHLQEAIKKAELD